MIVYAICGYRSKSDTWTGKWRDIDYKARNLVLASKGRQFNGFSMFGNVRVDSTPTGQSNARKIAAATITRKLMALGIETAQIVAVPSSSHTVLGRPFVGSLITSIIGQANSAFTSRPVLHFNECQPKSSEGNGRNAQTIAAALRLGAPLDARPIILFDDVYTSGAHVRAVRHFLNARGYDVHSCHVIGRTVWDQPESMFAMPPFSI